MAVAVAVAHRCSPPLLLLHLVGWPSWSGNLLALALALLLVQVWVLGLALAQLLLLLAWSPVRTRLLMLALVLALAQVLVRGWAQVPVKAAAATPPPPQLLQGAQLGPLPARAALARRGACWRPQTPAKAAGRPCAALRPPGRGRGGGGAGAG